MIDLCDDGQDYAPEHPCAFEADGTPILISEPVYTTPEPEPTPAESLDCEQLLQAILDRGDKEDVFERVNILGYLLRVSTAPSNTRELGSRLGISHTAATRKVSKFCEDLRREYMKMARKGFQRPHR